jgi:hypothetical protein
MTATAAYLWSKDVKEQCTAPYYGDWRDLESYIDVSKRFRDILKIWWTYAVVDFVRSIIALLAIVANSKAFAYIYHGLFLNDLLGVAAVVMVHVYRFGFSGKYCSGDFFDYDTAQPGLLVERGKILTGLVIYSWIGLLIHCCLMSCIYTAASRRTHSQYEGIKQ